MNAKSMPTVNQLGEYSLSVPVLQSHFISARDDYKELINLCIKFNAHCQSIERVFFVSIAKLFYSSKRRLQGTV